MERGMKKPPIDISELRKEESGEGEEPKQGSLSYVENGRPKRGNPGGDLKKFNLPQILISAVISLLLILVMSSMFSASKKDALVLVENQKELEDRIIALDEKYSGGFGRLDTVINTMGEYAKRSELVNYATTDSVSTPDLSSYITKDELPAQVDLSGYTKKSDLDVLAEDIEDLSLEVARLGVEEDADEGEEVLANPISIKVSDMGGVLTAESQYILSAPIKITLRKTLSQAVEDIVILLEIQTEGIRDVESVSLTGSGVSWRSSGWGYNIGYFEGVDFMNVGWGLDMDENDDKRNLYLVLKIVGNGITDYTDREYAFQVDAEVEDWGVE